MTEPKDYKETNFYMYQQLMSKLMNLSYGTTSKISFVVEQLSRYNTDLKNDNLQSAMRVV